MMQPNSNEYFDLGSFSQPDVQSTHNKYLSIFLRLLNLAPNLIIDYLDTVAFDEAAS